MNIATIHYHLEFYADDSTRVAHYENIGAPIVLPRLNDQVHFQNHDITLKITRVVHEFVDHFADEPSRFTLSHVVKVYGDKVP
jgi:hypothetical protein